MTDRPAAALRIDYDVGVPMRDGVLLLADAIARPPPAGPPVILIRTPYDEHS